MTFGYTRFKPDKPEEAGKFGLNIKSKVKDAMRPKDSGLRTISLFTGAGGLDLGLEVAGFSIAVCVESDEDACRSLTLNRPKWRLAQPADIFAIEPRALLEQADLRPGQATLLVGGPPCQPFSKSGYWANGEAPGIRDPRAATLLALLSIAEIALPRVILVENVRGLVASVGKRDSGLDVLLSGFDRINRRKKTNYRPHVIHLNAADFGVPQIRERIFVVASADGTPFEPPKPTHGSGEGLEPYLTAWDAIGDLDSDKWPRDLEPAGKWGKLLRSIPEGKNYLWLTEKGGGKPLFGWRTKYWSFLLKLSKRKPSWTIQANPGPATGPFHWRGRMLSVEEMLRLQAFPSGYRIVGNRRSACRQVGNAVPSAIGELFGREIRRQLLNSPPEIGSLSLIPRRRADCPRACRSSPVPKEYWGLIGSHPAHPGPGLGPRRTKQANKALNDQRRAIV